MTWVKRWTVRSSNGRRNYTVALDDNGEYGCSCLAWTRTVPRKDCKHIRQIRAENRTADAFNPQVEERDGKWILKF